MCKLTKNLWNCRIKEVEILRISITETFSFGRYRKVLYIRNHENMLA